MTIGRAVWRAAIALLLGTVPLLMTAAVAGADPTASLAPRAQPQVPRRPAPPSVTAGRAVVAFALAQVGKPYGYGATGPYQYDCSGLAMASWRAAGVQLPRTAAEQYYAGAHVALAQVQPGDLLFWASDPGDPATIYHVAISLGGDLMVQAPQTGQDVEVAALSTAGLVARATRP